MLTVQRVNHDVKIDGEYITLVCFFSDGDQAVISGLKFENILDKIRELKPASYTITGRHL